MKNKFLIISILPILFLASCQNNSDTKLSNKTKTEVTTTSNNVTDKPVKDEIKVLAPSGTPALALANFEAEHQGSLTVGGADLLLPNFISEKQEYDFIVAPLTVGLTTYNKVSYYKYYRSIVWGNFYIISKTVSSLEDLSNNKILAFQKNNTPDIILRTILDSNNIENCSIDYTSDVADAVAQFTSNKVDTIVIAEPSLSQLKSKGLKFNIIDMQEEYKKITGKSSYPQAALFVSENYIENYNLDILDDFKNTINDSNIDIETTANNAKNNISTFSTFSIDVLKSAIPNSNIKVEDDINTDKEAINFYLDLLKDLNLNTYGEDPKEDFYL